MRSPGTRAIRGADSGAGGDEGCLTDASTRPLPQVNSVHPMLQPLDQPVPVELSEEMAGGRKGTPGGWQPGSWPHSDPPTATVRTPPRFLRSKQAAYACGLCPSGAGTRGLGDPTQGDEEAGLAAALQSSSVLARRLPRSISRPDSPCTPLRSSWAEASADRGCPGPPPAVPAHCLQPSPPKALCSSQRDVLSQPNLSFSPIFQLRWVGWTP